MLQLFILLACAASVPGAQQGKPAEQGTAQKEQVAVQQSPPVKDQVKAKKEDDVVRISVTLVQVDAVVTDRHGKQVTDLQKDDFEIYEDGKRQQITNLSFTSTPPPSMTGAAAPPEAKGSPALPSPPVRLRPEEVRRTIAIVVDDLSLSMGSAESVQYYLRRFVERQMQPGDLVAIIRASGGMGALQQFTADKQQLRSAVDRIRWKPQSGRIGVFNPVRNDSLQSIRKGTPPDDTRKQQLEEELDAFRDQIFTVGMLGALNYVVRGLRELPGRKSVLLLSGNFKIVPGRDLARSPGLQRPLDRLQSSLHQLIELANRSAVVIYGLDPRGIVVPMMEAGDDVAGLTPQQRDRIVSQRRDELDDTQTGLDYLANETGGFVVAASNDLGHGIRRVLDDQNGYYLIGYVPEESTFKRTPGAAAFHKISVKVRVPGLRVRTRGGFLGVTNEEVYPVQRTPMDQLTAAITSPFTSGDVHLKLTSLFGNNAKIGYFVRALLHVDARDLKFTDEVDGWKSAAVNLVAITFGDNGVVVDQKMQSSTLKVRSEALDRTLRSGITCTIILPLKKPGAYQLRTAVRDVRTERIGSANQYIEVPDLSKGQLAISTVALGGNNLSADLNPVPSEHSSGSDTDEQIRTEAGPSVRRLRPGAELNYAFAVYNAKLDKAATPRLFMQLRLLRDGKPVYVGEAVPLSLKAQPEWKRINIAGSLKLTANATPGEYVFHISLTDTLAKEKHRTATQWADFEIVK
ncbi:MAG TPA: VWA domain-containing protein [Blastocatellia bacterium]|nr:VWA domain-containing protein [Blastocatellia bacterium]